MSHNKITVANQQPDSSGNVSIAMNDLSDVSGTPAAGTYLLYNGTGYDTVSTASVSVQCIFLGEGASSNYPRTLAAADEVCFYDSNPYNSIVSATLNTLSGQTDWYESITLPAGTFYMRGVCVGDFTASASPNMTYRFHDGSAVTGAAGASYDSVASGGNYPYESTAIITLASATTIHLRILTVSNANTTTTDNQSKYGHLYIMKVG